MPLSSCARVTLASSPRMTQVFRPWENLTRRLDPGGPDERALPTPRCAILGSSPPDWEDHQPEPDMAESRDPGQHMLPARDSQPGIQADLDVT